MPQTLHGEDEDKDEEYEDIEDEAESHEQAARPA